ncbi:hypothetical protein LCGC14_0694190 [marine sediment metagenome]|uniref:Uncharacterized protein n=1 Tax=marine sediment metagenome TaxID=412755 RepID=A0A0F9R4W9_9ZZZZ
MGCIYCGEHGCDDCMDITIAWKIYRNISSPPHIKMKKRKGIVTPNYIRQGG